MTREPISEIDQLKERLVRTNAEVLKLNDKIERLQTPICIGKPIIQTLARDGAWQSENGNGLIAADELFRNDPYAEVERLTEKVEILEAEIRVMRRLPSMIDALTALEPKP